MGKDSVNLDAFYKVWIWAPQLILLVSFGYIPVYSYPFGVREKITCFFVHDGVG